MNLAAHLQTGVTTVARAWAVTRSDGVVLGFTDHDRDLDFEGILFHARSGMTAGAMQQANGLAVDNTEALGALSDEAIREIDIIAGRYDGATVRLWWVNWADPAARELRFRGTLGEIRRTGGAFFAELRGLTEALGRPQGRIYQSGCTAVLGDAACRFDLSTPGYTVDAIISEVIAADRFMLGLLPGQAPNWFAKGRLVALGGAAAGLGGLIKADRSGDAGRVILLWQGLGITPSAGDPVRLFAGCDRRPETCREKFGNFQNFRGFPHIPGDDWMMAVPRGGDVHDGASLRR
jgi:uncharacterized phage protein (TIGR02218 family)